MKLQNPVGSRLPCPLSDAHAHAMQPPCHLIHLLGNNHRWECKRSRKRPWECGRPHQGHGGPKAAASNLRGKQRSLLSWPNISKINHKHAVSTPCFFQRQHTGVYRDQPRSKFGAPMFEPGSSGSQMHCIEESTCDIVGTFRHPGHCALTSVLPWQCIRGTPPSHPHTVSGSESWCCWPEKL